MEILRVLTARLPWEIGLLGWSINEFGGNVAVS